MLASLTDPRLRLALTWLAGFTLIDSSIVSLALPDIGSELGRSVGELAWVATGYLLALAATLLAAGWLNDRYGSRRVLGLGAVAFCCSCHTAADRSIHSRTPAGIPTDDRPDP